MGYPIEAVAVEKLRRIKENFLGSTSVPKPGIWRSMDDDLIWRGLVVQVMVVGGARSVEERFLTSPTLQRRISWSVLRVISSVDERKSAINAVLRQSRIRYASEHPLTCRKTKAIANNLAHLLNTGGPKALATKLGRLTSDREMIRELMSTFEYIKSKGARDFLMGHGYVRSALALDSRVIDIFKRLGVPIDGRVKTNEAVYSSEEQRLLKAFCEPLGMAGIECDRMLFQNFASIQTFLECEFEM